jgi:hypothetical protein
VRDHLNAPTHIPADLRSAAGLLDVLLIPGVVELGPVIGQDISGEPPA